MAVILPVLFVLTLLSPASVRAADTPAPAAAPTEAAASLPTAAQLETRIAEAKAATALDDANRAALIEQYRRALADLEAIRTAESRADDYARALAEAPRETQTLLDALERTRQKPEDPAPTALNRLSSEDIAQRLGQILADAAVQDTRIGEFDKLLDAGATRPATARARIAEIAQQLDQLAADLSQPPTEGQPPELTEARRWALETRRRALSAESRTLEQELRSQSVREALYKARRETADQALQTLKIRQRALETIQSERRLAEAAAAQRATALAEAAAAGKHALVQELTRENAEITELLGQMSTALARFDATRTGIESERQRIDEDFRGARQRLEAGGLTQALGQLLIDRRHQLPDLRQYRREIAQREAEITATSLHQIRYREEQRRLRDPGRYLDELAVRDPEARQPEVRTQLQAALTQRERLLTQLLEVEDDYIRQLGELNFVAAQLIETTERYDAFLGERLLWVRSALPVGRDTLDVLPAALRWIAAPERWREVTSVLANQFRRSPLLWCGLPLLALLIWRRSWILRALRATAEPLRRVRTDRLRFTAQAMGWTLLLALPLPLGLWLLGYPLTQPGTATEVSALARALGLSLMEIALGLYFLRTFRALCVPDGVADRHFRWPQEILRRIRRDFDAFTFYIVPVSLLALLFYNANEPAYNASLGRLALIAVMLGFAVFLARSLDPRTGPLRHVLAGRPEDWPYRTRYLWFGALVAIPLGLAALAVLGYVYTAGVLFQSLVWQTWLALSLVTAHQLIVRWLALTRRRLALQAALDRQAARRAAEERGDTGAGGPGPVEEPEPDLDALDGQTRRLVNTALFFTALAGLWLTWSEVLPALSLLDQFALWTYLGTVDGTAQPVPVTAADLGLVVLIVFIAVVAVRNLPALLEILLLQSSRVSAGGRYALRTMSRYLIVVAAAFMVSGLLGVDWSRMQWLVAALGVGIGFGLQEIVANFISGLIILFERPVRVGDIVTIGDTSGVVTNIQIRATTIRNWDRQELLVPNKEFITERLLNWSLTDQQNRISIPVSLVYGSDTRKAMALLLEIASAHERVLADPAPAVTFDQFGENALILILRCYLESLEGRPEVSTQLHQTIYETFAAEGLCFAAPQRDVNLAARQPLEVRVSGG